MAQYKNKAFTLRIDNTLQEKIKIIAEKEDRTVTAQYERIVKKYIADYETQHGEIQVGGVKCLISRPTGLCYCA